MPEPLLKFLSDYKVLCLVLGAAFLAVGLVGGGLTVKEIKIPSVSGVYRAMTILVGALLMGSGFLVSTESPSKEEAVQYQQQDYDTGMKYYLICSIAANDPDGGLVVRSLPGVLGEMGHEHMRVGRIPPDGRHVRYLGKRSLVGQRYWYQVTYDFPEDTNFVAGWVNSRFLCPEEEGCSCQH